MIIYADEYYTVFEASDYTYGSIQGIYYQIITGRLNA